MFGISQKVFEEELTKLDYLKNRVQISLQKAPKGVMRCEMNKGKYPQYYIIQEIDGCNNLKYLTKKQHNIARIYAQKEYNEKLLNVIEKREKIIKNFLEHFGMMDDSEYCKKAIEKMNLYRENEIYMGEKLLSTFESSLIGINLREIDLYIKKYFT